uniref:Uncharacterized protein n=1 Tax=Magallana gigas TaxID=29159 RepID=K1QV90_MAGGI
MKGKLELPSDPTHSYPLRKNVWIRALIPKVTATFSSVLCDVFSGWTYVTGQLTQNCLLRSLEAGLTSGRVQVRLGFLPHRTLPELANGCEPNISVQLYSNVALLVVCFFVTALCEALQEMTEKGFR